MVPQLAPALGACSAAGRRPRRPPGLGLDARLIGFTEELRGEGVAIGTSELLDAFAALDEVPWTVREDFKEALAATLAKSPEDRRVFELVFDRFFFRAAEAEAAVQGVTEGEGFDGADQIDVDALREQIAQRCRTARRARCATSRDSRSPPSASAARALA